MGIAHFALYFGARHHGRHRVNDNGVDGARAHQRLANFQRLFAGVWLRDKQRVNIHPKGLGVHRVQRVLYVNEGHLAAALLRLGNAVKGQRRLARRFRPVNFHHTAAGQAADAKGQIERERAGGDCVHLHGDVLPQLHNGALAKLLFNLAQRGLQRTFLVARRLALRRGHGLLFICHGFLLQCARPGRAWCLFLYVHHTARHIP